MKTRGRIRSSAALGFLALIVLLSMICEVSSWSARSKRTTLSVPSSSTSCSDVTLASERPNVPSSSLTSRRSVLSTAAWSLVLTEAAVLASNPIAAHAAEETSFLYTRNQNVLNKKNLSYQISIPSSMKEGSKPVKTHLDEVNFVSDSVKRYQYGITVDPVRISSLKEVRPYLTDI